MDRFPHLDDTPFPMTAPVDAYKYENEYDYDEYDNVQMEVVLCRVPWDVGNVHVGNTIIPGLGNTVYFDGGKEERNAYFDNMPKNEKYVWRTKYSDFHSDGRIRLPVPFDMLATYNYVYVKYNTTPNAETPLDYETGGGVKRWFYFVREMNKLAPNTTEVILLRDTWQTFIYDINIPFIRLERGHYGIAHSDVAKFLENPKENGEWVIGTEEDYGFGEITEDTVARILNDKDMMAVIFTWANPTASWGTAHENSWKTPAYNAPHQNGVTAPYAFGCSASNFDANIGALYKNVPQFIRTIQGVAFIPQKCLNLGTSFNFAGVSWSPISSSQKTLEPVNVKDLNFNIPEEYAHLAKMYTSPYSWIEVTDFCGNRKVVKIEETIGILDFKVCANLAFPYLNYEFTVNGIGSVANTFTFRQLSQREFTAGGKWYDYIFEQNIPVFALSESGEQANQYDRWWARDAQENMDRVNRTNADASALADYENGKDNADMEQANANRSAVTDRDNTKATSYTNKTNNNAAADTDYGVSVRDANAAKTTGDRSNATDLTNAHTTADYTYRSGIAGASGIREVALRSAWLDRCNAMDMAFADNNDSVSTVNISSANNAIDVDMLEFQYELDAITANANTGLANANASYSFQAGNANTWAAFGTGTAQNVITSTVMGAMVAGPAGAAAGAAGAIAASVFSGAATYMTASNDHDSTQKSVSSNAQMVEVQYGFRPRNTSIDGGSGDLSSWLPIDGSIRLPSSVGTLNVFSTNLVGKSTRKNIDTKNEVYRLASALSLGQIANAYNVVTGHENEILRTDSAGSFSRFTKNPLIEYDSNNPDNDKFPGIANRNHGAAVENANVNYESTQRNLKWLYGLNDQGTSPSGSLNGLVYANALRDNSTTAQNLATEQSTSISDASDIRTVVKANATRTNNTELDNADGTYQTAVDNAEDVHDTDYANLKRTYDTTVANDLRTMNAELYMVKADRQDQQLDAPYVRGNVFNAEDATVKPNGLLVNACRQPDALIRQVGDNFLRWGYAAHRSINFETFNVMPFFSFWKCEDVSIYSSSIADAYLDDIRFLLIGGVTIWRRPEDINAHTIYDNKELTHE